MRICHFSSLHDVDDIRVFVKECTTLAAAGHEVHLVACGFKGEKIDKQVHLIGMGNPPNNRIKRMLFFSKKVFKAAQELNCDVYHFHDPELLMYGRKLKKQGKRVVFDSHEDVPAQIMDKVWIPKSVRWVVSSIYKIIETSVVKEIDAVVAATPYIREQFRNRALVAIDINNYPRMDDIEFSQTPFSEREKLVCYAGGINDLRGEQIMVDAMNAVRGSLIIAGDHEMMKVGNVEYVGRLDREGINALYGKAIAGLCILKPIANYINSQPIKMYEYMAAGIPFICSNFPRWEKIAEESGAGICVDPQNSQELSTAINELMNDTAKAQEMGHKGFEYMKKNCSWDREGEKLLGLYENILH